MPDRIPNGVPMNVAMVINKKLPIMALAKPPPSVLGGGVISVNTSQDNPPTPFVKVEYKIQANQTKPKITAIIEITIAILFLKRRLACRRVAIASSLISDSPLSDSSATT